ncbi:MAG: hypothetical protein HYV07_10545 [Deltaproteobacteria bacterium]|nr:hypothetical protein [Deltaproteobacteria bacterium]
MPRKVYPEDTIESLTEERRYTESRVRDEGLPAEVVTRVHDWQTKIGGLREGAEALEDHDSMAAAAQAGANYAMDVAVEAFGDDLLRACGKDRKSSRFRAFFKSTVNEFKRQPFPDQVRAMRGWFDGGRKEPVLDQHAARLEAQTQRGEKVLKLQVEADGRRVELRKAREAFADWFTQERDDLHDDLSKIAREQGFGREWADTFFRKDYRPAQAKPASAPGTAEATHPPPTA